MIRDSVEVQTVAAAVETTEEEATQKTVPVKERNFRHDSQSKTLLLIFTIMTGSFSMITMIF